MQYNKDNLGKVAVKLLESEGICPKEAALLVIDMVRHSGRNLPRLREKVMKGLDYVKASSRSISFQRAVEETLAAKQHRRKRTLQCIKYTMGSLINKFPELKRKKINNITSRDCRQYIDEGFSTPHSRHKARVLISGVFSVAIKRGWCDHNPVANVDTPVLKEKTVKALQNEEVRNLMQAAEKERYRDCKPAVALMIYAGIRPGEVERLSWQDINLEEGIITLRAKHSKTGGSRHVNILAPLERILRNSWMTNGAPSICPKNWRTKWRKLRKEAGWNNENPWPQDVLRHTFASYYIKYFRDFPKLQCEMGHRSSDLLRSRYLNMEGITLKSAMQFWMAQ